MADIEPIVDRRVDQAALDLDVQRIEAKRAGRGWKVLGGAVTAVGILAAISVIVAAALAASGKHNIFNMGKEISGAVSGTVFQTTSGALSMGIIGLLTVPTIAAGVGLIRLGKKRQAEAQEALNNPPQPAVVYPKDAPTRKAMVAADLTERISKAQAKLDAAKKALQEAKDEKAKIDKVSTNQDLISSQQQRIDRAEKLVEDLTDVEENVLVAVIGEHDSLQSDTDSKRKDAVKQSPGTTVKGVAIALGIASLVIGAIVILNVALPAIKETPSLNHLGSLHTGVASSGRHAIAITTGAIVTTSVGIASLIVGVVSFALLMKGRSQKAEKDKKEQDAKNAINAERYAAELKLQAKAQKLHSQILRLNDDVRTAKKEGALEYLRRVAVALKIDVRNKDIPQLQTEIEEVQTSLALQRQGFTLGVNDKGQKTISHPHFGVLQKQIADLKGQNTVEKQALEAQLKQANASAAQALVAAQAQAKADLAAALAAKEKEVVASKAAELQAAVAALAAATKEKEAAVASAEKSHKDFYVERAKAEEATKAKDGAEVLLKAAEKEAAEAKKIVDASKSLLGKSINDLKAANEEIAAKDGVIADLKKQLLTASANLTSAVQSGSGTPQFQPQV